MLIGFNPVFIFAYGIENKHDQTQIHLDSMRKSIGFDTKIHTNSNNNN